MIRPLNVREDWETRFGYALLKIQRADKHIADFHERLIQAGNAYTASQALDPETGKYVLHYTSNDVSVKRDLTLILGDAVHNLRSAIDISWMALLENRFPHAFDPKRNKFPISNNETHFIGTLKSREIHPGTPLFEFLVGYVKPYIGGGNTDLLAIHDLDINDKHIALIPTLSVATIQGVKFKDERGRMGQSTITKFSAPLYQRFEIPFEYKADDYGKVILDVMFGEGTTFENTQIRPALRRFREKVFEIVGTFRGL